MVVNRINLADPSRNIAGWYGGAEFLSESASILAR
jgi:hypothetical protein